MWKVWSKRKKTADDEIGTFSFILQRADINNNESAFTREGQVVSLTDGSKRVHWRHSRRHTVLSAVELEQYIADRRIRCDNIYIIKTVYVNYFNNWFFHINH